MTLRMLTPRECGFLVLATLLGCTEGVESPYEDAVTSNPPSSAVTRVEEPRNGETETDETQTASASAKTIELIPVDASLLQSQIDRYRGKIVLVDFWALWCTTCLEEFPDTVALHRDLGPEGLVVLGLNFDSPNNEARLEAVKSFLKNNGADFPQLVCSVTGGSRSMDEFKLEEGLPHYRIYGRNGQLLESFNGKPENLREQLSELLSENKDESR